MSRELGEKDIGEFGLQLNQPDRDLCKDWGGGGNKI